MTEDHMTEELIILEPGDEQAEKIAKAMSSRTAGRILGSLSGKVRSSTEIADALSIPITTVAYHIGNLLDAGLLNVAETRWSSKGREVKVYGLAGKMVVIAPPVTDIRSLFLKYAGLFGIISLATLLLAVLAPLQGAAERGGVMAAGSAGSGSKSALTAMDASAVQGVPFFHDLVMAFFFGGCIVLFALMLYEVGIWRRMR